MKMEIYADLVFLINFIMDFFILWIVSKLIKKRIKLWRMLLGGFIMAFLYALTVFLAPLRVYLNIFAAILILMLGIMAAFQPKDVKEFFKLILLAHTAAFSLGGLSIALFYFTNISNVIGNMVGVTIRHFSFKILLASSCLFYILSKLALAWYKERVIRKQICYPITIFFENNDVSLNALLDTGNSLRDPLSNEPVIIAEFNTIKEFLSDELRLIFYEKRENDYSSLISHIEDSNLSGRFRMIPFISLGKQNGMLIGFKPDKVLVESEKGSALLNNVVVGIYNFKLSADGAYQGLLNPEVIDTGG